MASAGPSDEDTEGSVDEDFREPSQDRALSDEASEVSEPSERSGSQQRSLVILQGACRATRSCQPIGFLCEVLLGSLPPPPHMPPRRPPHPSPAAWRKLTCKHCAEEGQADDLGFLDEALLDDSDFFRDVSCSPTILPHADCKTCLLALARLHSTRSCQAHPLMLRVLDADGRRCRRRRGGYQ